MSKYFNIFACNTSKYCQIFRVDLLCLSMLHDLHELGNICTGSMYSCMSHVGRHCSSSGCEWSRRLRISIRQSLCPWSCARLSVLCAECTSSVGFSVSLILEDSAELMSLPLSASSASVLARLDIASAVGWNVLSTFEVPEEHSGGRVHHERGTFTLDSRRWYRLDNTEAKASYAIMNDSNFRRHFQVFKLSQSELQVGLRLSYKLKH